VEAYLHRYDSGSKRVRTAIRTSMSFATVSILAGMAFVDYLSFLKPA
jgi:hypothetical protein